MFERLNTPEELYHYKLGAALKMEQTVLEMLDENAQEAQDAKLAELFRHHQDETREQIQNLEKAFDVFGWEVDDSPCPAIQGIEKEGKANAKKTDDALVDAVLLSGAAVYEGLITFAQAMGKGEVVELLEHNLEQEKHTLEEVRNATHRIAAQKVGAPA